MILSSYETHNFPNPQLPFIFHPHYHLAGSEIETNWHKNIEILCCLQGKGYVRCGSEIYDFTENDIVVVNSDTLHTVGSITSLDYCCLIIGSNFCTDNGLAAENLVFHNVIRDLESLALMKAVACAFSDYNSQKPYAVADCRYVVLGILRKLCRDHSSQQFVNPSKVSGAHIKKAITYIRTHMDKPLSLDEIADHAGISKYHLCREFKSVTGSTIVSYINILRCSEAKRLIEKGMRVSEAAYSCGFDNLSYFSRIFQKLIGSPPSAFLKKE